MFPPKDRQNIILTRKHSYKVGSGLWCLTPFLTIFQSYRGDQFYWWMKPEYAEKTIDLPQVIDKHYHIKLYCVLLDMSGIRTHNYRDDNH